VPYLAALGITHVYASPLAELPIELQPVCRIGQSLRCRPRYVRPALCEYPKAVAGSAIAAWL
jgi:hypothetical protein